MLEKRKLTEKEGTFYHQVKVTLTMMKTKDGESLTTALISALFT